MWRAIMSSSLVGITQAETLLFCVDIRGPLLVLAAFVKFDPEPGRSLADSLADLRGVLADTRREYESIDSAEYRSKAPISLAAR